VYLVTLRNILAGEELFATYGGNFARIRKLKRLRVQPERKSALWLEQRLSEVKRARVKRARNPNVAVRSFTPDFTETKDRPKPQGKQYERKRIRKQVVGLSIMNVLCVMKTSFSFRFVQFRAQEATMMMSADCRIDDVHR
jgi:hypothetical protein